MERLKKLFIDPVDHAFCIVRATGLLVVGLWAWAALVTIVKGHPHLEAIALSGSSIVGTIGVALAAKQATRKAV